MSRGPRVRSQAKTASKKTTRQFAGWRSGGVRHPTICLPPCVLTCDLAERTAIDAARRAGIELLGLSALHAAGDAKAGFLMGFAAYTPLEIEAAVKKLANALRAVTKP